MKYVKGALGTKYFATCPQCKHPYDGHVYCSNCQQNMLADGLGLQIPKDHRFGWLLNENKWKNDIMSRRKAPDGSVVRVKHGEKPRWEN